jgi:hypothetical protein
MHWSNYIFILHSSRVNPMVGPWGVDVSFSLEKALFGKTMAAHKESFEMGWEYHEHGILCAIWVLHTECFTPIGVGCLAWIFFILDIYGYHIYWYIIRVQVGQICINPDWPETGCTCISVICVSRIRWDVFIWIRPLFWFHFTNSSAVVLNTRWLNNLWD